MRKGFDDPLYVDDAKKLANDKLMSDYLKSLWKEAEAGTEWPFYADIGFQLEPFYTKNGLPLVLLVTTEDMRIRLVNVGHNATYIKSWITTLLNE